VLGQHEGGSIRHDDLERQQRTDERDGGRARQRSDDRAEPAKDRTSADDDGGDAVEFAEFTAIYPIGSLNASIDYRGRQIPLYPTPGRRALTNHQRTGTVDHIPDVQVYSYSPWIPYMHVGPRMHNAFHTLYWRMDVDRTSFLPEEWRHGARAHHEVMAHMVACPDG